MRAFATGHCKSAPVCVSKNKKLYPLHIVMLVFAAFANYISFRNEVVWGKFGLKFLLNLLLIDDWFPRNDIFSQFLKKDCYYMRFLHISSWCVLRY